MPPWRRSESEPRGGPRGTSRVRHPAAKRDSFGEVALVVVVGAAVILFDPIFQGLAIALMAGEIASLLISRMAVPVLYYMAARTKVRTSN